MIIDKLCLPLKGSQTLGYANIYAEWDSQRKEMVAKMGGSSWQANQNQLLTMRERPTSIKHLLHNVELTDFVKSLTLPWGSFIIVYDKFAEQKTKHFERDQNKTM